MSSSMPGNPHFDLAGESIRASWPKTETAPLHLQSAQVEATLALAFEQRTANLIALTGMKLQVLAQGADFRGELAEELNSRLGWGGDDVH